MEKLRCGRKIEILFSCFIPAACLIETGCASSRQMAIPRPSGDQSASASTELGDRVEQVKLAKKIDELDTEQTLRGTIGVKAPDIWGQDRMTRFRSEYDKLIGGSEGQGPKFSSNGKIIHQVDGVIRVGASAGQGAADTSDSKSLIDPSAKPAVDGDASPITLERRLILDEQSEYLNHLNQLRRVNAGDELTDRPGYELYLIRMPISLAPGAESRVGKGAMVTVEARPFLNDSLLRETFRRVVLHDATVQLKDVLIKRMYSNSPQRAVAEALPRRDGALVVASTEVEGLYGEENLALLDEELSRRFGNKQGPDRHHRDARVAEWLSHEFAAAYPIAARIADEGSTENLKLSDVSRMLDDRQYKKLAQYRDLSHGKVFASRVDPHLSRANYQASPTDPDEGSQVDDSSRRKRVTVSDESSDDRRPIAAAGPRAIEEIVQGGAKGKQESNDSTSAYDSESSNRTRGGGARRTPYHDQLDESTIHEDGWDAADEADSATKGKKFKAKLAKLELPDEPISRLMTYMLIIHSVAVDRQIKDDIKVVASNLERRGDPGRINLEAVKRIEELHFYGNTPNYTSKMLFLDYVAAKWPIRVFAIDPVIEQQNVSAVDSRRRDRQLDLGGGLPAVGIGARARASLARGESTDMATIQLNPTMVGFGAGESTFGWRFYPRIQPPPRKGLRAGLELLTGNSEADAVKGYRIEPGQRECSALIVMPCFVDSIEFTTVANWFDADGSLPAAREKMEEALRANAKLLEAKRLVDKAMSPYRKKSTPPPQELKILEDRVVQVHDLLPMQNYISSLPSGGEAVGSEIFDSLGGQLAPSLLAWYGEPPVQGGESTIFLQGRGFSVHETNVLVGGRPATVVPISRSLLQVKLDKEARPTRDDDNCLLDVNVATPNGVSNHLLIEMTPAPPPEPKEGDVAKKATRAEGNNKPASRERVKATKRPETEPLPAEPAVDLDDDPSLPPPTKATKDTRRQAADGWHGRRGSGD